MAQAEFQRVRAGGLGQFVHEGFDGEDIRVAAQRAHCRSAQWQAAHQMLNQPRFGKPVKRVLIAVQPGVTGHVGRHHGRMLRFGPEARRQQPARPHAARPRTRPVQMGVAMGFVRPGRHRAGIVQAGR